MLVYSVSTSGYTQPIRRPMMFTVIKYNQLDNTATTMGHASKNKEA